MAGIWKTAPLIAALAVTALVTACDNGPSAVASQPQAAGTQMAYSEQAPPDREAAPRREPVKLLDGKPEWAASRRYSAAESAQRAFDRNGESFGARSRDDYIRRAHSFIEHPPKGVETLTRANGDVLYYDARANVFAVADKAGSPRTMFKPDDGAAYWQEQKDRQARSADRRSRKTSDDDA